MTMKSPGQWPGGKPPEIVHDYVDWLCTPEADRDPRTKTAWAKEHTVDYSTVKRWDTDDRVKQLITLRANSLNMGPERVQQVMNAIYNKAKGGDMTAAKLYMDHVDKITPRKTGKEDLSDLTAEELAELAALSAEV
jgi:nitrogen regulatory protein PII